MAREPRSAMLMITSSPAAGSFVVALRLKHTGFWGGPQAKSRAGDQTIMYTAGHVSRQMLARYDHIRMEGKRKVLEGIVSKPAPARQALNSGARSSSTARFGNVGG